MCAMQCSIVETMSLEALLRTVIEEVKTTPTVKVPTFDWFGLAYDPFPDRELNPDEIETFFVDRDAELKSLLKSLLSTIIEGKGMVVIVGPPGMGKSTLKNALLYTVEKYSDEIEKELGKSIKGEWTPFDDLMTTKEDVEDEDQEEKHMFLRYVQSFPKNANFCFFDQCDRNVHSISQHLNYFSKHHRNTTLILALSYISWKVLQADYMEFAERCETVVSLEPFPPAKIRELLKKRLKETKIFEDKSLDLIIQSSYGVPKFAVDLARKSMNIARQHGLKSVDINMAKEALMPDLNLTEAEIALKRLTYTEMEIAKWILESLDGCSADAVSEKFGFTRPTAVHHLRDMLDKHVLLTQKRGRRLYYYLSPSSRTMLELKMMSKEV
jgi:Cdc6-like AAA superfamily ATPase